MQRMSPQDAAFLHIENDVTAMHIGSVSVFAGPPPTYAELLDTVAGKLPLARRYRQRVAAVPTDLGRPVWVDDPDFRLVYHVRHTALPRPGGEPQLRALVGRLMSQHLDRSKPLWEMYFVEGLADDHWAIVSKLHHCMVDGIAAADLMSVLLDREPEPSAPVTDDWRPEPLPRAERLVADALLERLLSPAEMVRSVRALLRAPRPALQLLQNTAEGLLALAGPGRPAGGNGLAGPIGPHRSYAWARLRLADVKAVRLAFGGTVNDVVLAAVTGGFRELLLSRGEPVAGTVVRSLVPVSVRRPDERGTGGNRVSGLVAELPVGEPDPVVRLRLITTALRDLKESRQAVAGEVLTSMSGFAPPMLLALGARLAVRVAARSLTTVTTNVPGPAAAQFLLGHRMLEVFPYVCLAAQLRTGVAIVSYAGRLGVGVTGDADSTPDVDVLAGGVEAAMTELVKAAGRLDLRP